MTDFNIKDQLAGKYDRSKLGERQTLRTVMGINQVLEVAANPRLSLNQKTTLLKSIGDTHMTPYPNSSREEIESDNMIAEFAYVSELLAKSASQSPERLTKAFGGTRTEKDLMREALIVRKRLFQLFDGWERMGVNLDPNTAKSHCIRYDVTMIKMSAQTAVNKWFGSNRQ